ncbi:ABC transporter permease [Anaeromicropila herbilytica]|uniref:Permease n=1 Tax=Anaeromicropila herbilytica TaxID=2785025 RepID=A0A7R7IDR6_9FIRM|nr:ABC transporter permease [Anaeromicropila herbilytica]BCN31822.1 permease [Anaeromicropila herbilytica]
MNFSFKIAVRFLKSSKGQTLLIVLGIAVGVSVQIFIGSLIQGLQKNLLNKTIGNSSHITVISKNQDNRISNYNQIINKITHISQDITNVSISYDSPALINLNNKNYSVLIRGLNLNTASKIYHVKEQIYEGKAPKRNSETIIGKELQKELGIKLGDELTINTNIGQEYTLKVTGFYDLKVSSLNKTWMITTLDTAQHMFGGDNTITNIEMQVKDVFAADQIADRLSNVLSSRLKVENWKSQNESLLSGLNGQSISSIIIQVFVLVSVALAIASVLAITVIQKSKQIGILKAMGITDKTASLIFLFEGLLLGIIGSILGVLFGLLLGFSFSTFVTNPDGTPIVALTFNYSFILFSVMVAIIASMFAALIPAKRSSQLNPIEVIRNG